MDGRLLPQKRKKKKKKKKKKIYDRGVRSSNSIGGEAHL